MPQSLAKILVHLIYSTKHREPVLHEQVREELHRYTAGILKQLDSPALLINSMPDHVHILYLNARTRSPSQIVEELKIGSSKWLKTKGPGFSDFHWQNGYGAFSVSQSGVPEVLRYIEHQKEHHQRKSFQDEYREFLARYQVPFDERYVWD